MMLIKARTVARLCVVLALGIVFCQAKAARPEIFPDIKRIINVGVLRVALLGKDAPPLIMTNAKGELSGTEPELARDLAQKLGVKVKFNRNAKTYDGVINIVARKEADIAVSYLTGDVQRALYVLFSRPYIRQSGRLFYNRAYYAKLQRDYKIEDLQAINNLPDAAKITVGVEKGSVNAVYIARDFPNVKLKTFPDLAKIMAAVKTGKIFAGMYGSLRTNFYLRRHPALAIYIAVDSKIRVSSDIRIAVRPDAPDLLRWINLYLANNVGMMDHKKIIDRYLGKLSEDSFMGKKRVNE